MRTLEAARPSGRSGERHGVRGIACRCLEVGQTGFLTNPTERATWASGLFSSGITSARLRRGQAHASGRFTGQSASGCTSCGQGPVGGYYPRRSLASYPPAWALQVFLLTSHGPSLTRSLRVFLPPGPRKERRVPVKIAELWPPGARVGT